MLHLGNALQRVGGKALGVEAFLDQSVDVCLQAELPVVAQEHLLQCKAIRLRELIELLFLLVKGRTQHGKILAVLVQRASENVALLLWRWVVYDVGKVLCCCEDCFDVDDVLLVRISVCKLDHQVF